MVKKGFQKIIIYTDGGSRNNPGFAGAGVYITDDLGTKLHEIAKPLGIQTNNFAEYEAVILGLEAVKKIFGKEKLKDTDVEVRSDSELVIRQLTGKYQIKEETLFPKFIKIWNLKVSDFPNITFTHIPREKNKEADRLSNEAMDQAVKERKLL